MDKNSIIGFVLIGAVLFGFTFYQSKQQAKYAEVAKAYQDSIARVDSIQRAAADSIAALQVSDQTAAGAAVVGAAAPAATPAVAAPGVYKDAALDSAATAEPEVFYLENDKVKIALTTRGAQPASAMVKDYFNYDSTALYIFKEGNAEFAVSVYTGEYINTKDFTFQIVEKSDSTATMRLPFTGGAYIEQKYKLEADSYALANELSFVGMDRIIPRNVSSFDVDYKMIIPRMEKGYKGEVQYSKVNYYFEGEKSPEEMARGRNGSEDIPNRLSWFAFQQQFFSAIVRAPKEFASGKISANFYSQEDESHNLMACQADMRCDYQAAQTVTVPFEYYFGPNNYNILKSYDHKYEKIVPLGGSLVGWFTKYVIIPLFNWLHKFIGNFGLIILLMTIIIKLVVLPFTYKSYASSAKMQAIKPLVEKINEKYPKQEDAMKKQQATMDLYKRAGINTLGGCLPMLLTLPILWAMFRFFPASIELRQQPFLWCDDLSAYDSIIDFGFRIPLLGDHISLFALLMAVVMFLYSKMTTAQQAASNDPTAKSMQLMTVWMMPIMMFFICNSLSAALSYYYLLSQLIAIVETWVIRTYCVDKEAILEKVRKSEGKPVQKSKWQLRLEEAQRMQAQQQAQRKK